MRGVVGELDHELRCDRVCEWNLTSDARGREKWGSGSSLDGCAVTLLQQQLLLLQRAIWRQAFVAHFGILISNRLLVWS